MEAVGSSKHQQGDHMAMRAGREKAATALHRVYS